MWISLIYFKWLCKVIQTIDHNDNIMCFKIQSNRTSANFRANFSLRRNEMKNLQLSCAATKSEIEFQETIMLLLLLFHVIKFNSIFYDFSDISSICSHFSSNYDNDDDDTDLSSVESSIMLSNFLNGNDNDFFQMKMQSISTHNRWKHLLLSLVVRF